jgi:hypothetical protein
MGELSKPQTIRMPGKANCLPFLPRMVRAMTGDVTSWSGAAERPSRYVAATAPIPREMITSVVDIAVDGLHHVAIDIQRDCELRASGDGF